MLVGLLIAGTLSLSQAASPPPAPPARVATSALHIPEEIAPAIIPYVQCMMASQGVPVRDSQSGAPVRPAVPRGGDCSPHRAEAARRAEAMLRTQGRGTLAERRAFVERVLASVDSFADSLAHPPATLPAEPRSFGSGSPLDVRVPNAIVGLHNQYVRCQDQNFDIGHVRSQDTFQAEVERAIAACASQKATLMQQAETVLAASTEFADAAVRQRAIAEAFDGYDRTRRLMARAGSR